MKISSFYYLKSTFDVLRSISEKYFQFYQDLAPHSGYKELQTYVQNRINRISIENSWMHLNYFRMEENRKINPQERFWLTIDVYLKLPILLSTHLLALVFVCECVCVSSDALQTSGLGTANGELFAMFTKQ